MGEKRRRSAAWYGIAAAVLAVSGGCALKNTDLEPVRDAQFVPEPDERPMWEFADRLDVAVEEADLRYEHAALQRYLDAIAARLLNEMGAPTAAVRVFVLRDPFLNAFALPNGSIYLHSGIIARIENEAQLATVLGHELSHFLRRHSLKDARTAENSRRTGRAAMTDFAAAVAGAGGDPTLARIFTDIADSEADQLLAVRVEGYSALLELEADADSFDAIRRAGYDPREAPKVFHQLQEDRQESALPEPYFFGSHPRLEERIAFHTARVKSWTPPADPSGLHVGTPALDEAISALLLENAMMDLRVRRYARARRAVDRHLARNPSSAQGYYWLGEVQRQKGARPEALAAYARATELDPTFADPYREIGMLQRAHGHAPAARAAFERYLELTSTDAPDHAIVQGYVVDLRTQERAR